LDITEGKTRLKVRRASPLTITPEQNEIFFATLAETCNVVRSARAAGFSANWAYRRRKFDGAFRNSWAAAVREGYSKLELVLLQRAIEGTPKYVSRAGGGERVVREYSTALAVALLKRHADLADSVAQEPNGDELSELRERILEKLDGLKRRELGESDEAPVETKGWDRVGVIMWGLRRNSGWRAPSPSPRSPSASRPLPRGEGNRA
jgi:hypothetical protein